MRASGRPVDAVAGTWSAAAVTADQVSLKPSFRAPSPSPPASYCPLPLPCPQPRTHTGHFAQLGLQRQRWVCGVKPVLLGLTLSPELAALRYRYLVVSAAGCMRVCVCMFVCLCVGCNSKHEIGDTQTVQSVRMHVCVCVCVLGNQPNGSPPRRRASYICVCVCARV